MGGSLSPGRAQVKPCCDPGQPRWLTVGWTVVALLCGATAAVGLLDEKIVAGASSPGDRIIRSAWDAELHLDGRFTVGAAGSVNDATAASTFARTVLMQGFTSDLPPCDPHESEEHKEGHQPGPGGLTEADDGGIESDAAGAAEEERPEFTEEIRSFRGTDFVSPESTEGFAAQASGVLCCGTVNGHEQAFDVVCDAVDVAFLKLPLVGPAIAEFTQFADQTAFYEGELVAEEFVPVIPHEDQKCLSIPGLDVAAIGMLIGQQFIRRTAGHIRPEAAGKYVECVGDRIDH